jgi:hypothetical protein
MTPARRNGAVPTNPTANQQTTTMRKMLCLDTYLYSLARVRKKRIAPRARTAVPGSQKVQPSSRPVNRE